MKTRYFLLTTLLYLVVFQSLQSQTANWAWARSIGNDEELYGSGNLVDPENGDVYVTGTFRDIVDFDPGPGVYELEASIFGSAFILKTDSHGNFLWAKAFGGFGANAGGGKLVFDKSGNIIVVGAFSGLVDFDPGPDEHKVSSGGDGSTFIAKLTTDGEFIWAGSFNGGGSNYANDIAVDYTTGDLYLTGSFDDIPTDFDPGPGVMILGGQLSAAWTIFIVKLDSTGNAIWAKQYGGYSAWENDAGNAVAIDTKNGDVYFVGQFNGACAFHFVTDSIMLTSLGGSDGFLAKLDKNGNLEWAFSMGGAEDDACTDIVIDPLFLGTIHVAGYFHDKLSFTNGEHFLNGFGGADIFRAVVYTDSEIPYVYMTGGPGDDYPTSLILDKARALFMSGIYTEPADLHPGVMEVEYQNSRGSEDFFITKINQDRTYAWSKTGGGTNQDHMSSIALDAEGNIHATGFFRSTQIFFDDADTLIGGQLPVTNDLFIAKLDLTTIVDTDNPTQINWSVFPNPASTNVTIETSNQPADKTMVEIYDVNGIKIDQAVLIDFKNSLDVDLSNYPAGMYIISLTNSGTTSQQVIVKQ